MVIAIRARNFHFYYLIRNFHENLHVVAYHDSHFKLGNRGAKHEKTSRPSGEGRVSEYNIHLIPETVPSRPCAVDIECSCKGFSGFSFTSRKDAETALNS